MAEEGDDSDKTEEPSQRKLQKALEDGDVVKSQEVPIFFTLAGVTAIVAWLSGPAVAELLPTLRGLVEHAAELSLDGGGLRRIALTVSVSMLLALAAPFLLMAVMAIAGNLIQHPLVFSGKTLKPELSKISLLKGLKRQFSLETVINFVKGILKLILIGAIMMAVLWPERDRFDAMIRTDVAEILAIVKALAVRMLGAMLAAMFVIAIADYVIAWFRYMKRQRMSLQEVKDEYKQTEGDPTVKGKLKQLRQERGRQRMLSAVPTATVVVTNPTHYAVALRYESGMQAPVCVAKGVDEVALRIREIAAANTVTIVENPPLARALHASVEIDEEIPEKLYKAVAEVIGYVMNLKKRGSWRG